MTALYAIQVLGKTFTHEAIQSLLIPLIVDLVADPVANVRFTVARTLECLIVLMQGGADSVESALHTLSTDSDRDVRYYALKV